MMVGMEGMGGAASGSGDMSSAVAFRRLRPVSLAGGADVSTAAFLTPPLPRVVRLLRGVSSSCSVAASPRLRRDDRRGVGSGLGSRGGSGVGVLLDAISWSVALRAREGLLV